MIAVYDDETADEWRVFALRVDPTEVNGDKRRALRLYDDTTVYFLSVDAGGDRPEHLDTRSHEIGLCPVVRLADLPDPDGRAPGEVEPLIPVQNRINQTIFDLLVAQTLSALKIGTMSGMAPRVDDMRAGRPRVRAESTDAVTLRER